jgi:hypothetical protein
MLPRLDELETDLTARRRQAEQQRWLGEIEGLDLTLQHLRRKRDQTQALAQRLAESGPITLGFPAMSAGAGTPTRS